MEATRTKKAAVTMHPDDARPVTVPAGLLGELLREAIADPAELIIPTIAGRVFWGDPDDSGIPIVDDSGRYRLGFVAWADLAEIVDTIRAARCHVVWQAAIHHHREHGEYPVKPAEVAP